MNRIILLNLVFVLFIFSCVESKNEPNILKFPVKTKIIYFNSSNVFELVITGHKVDGKVYPEDISIRRADSMGSGLKYMPVDQASLESSAFDFTYAWSPNGDRIVLPRGRFEGFEVFSTEHLLEDIKKGKEKLSIGIKDATGTMMWHEFLGWQNDNTIVFKAGLSDKAFTFEWNVQSGDLASLDLKKGQYEVEK